MSRFAWDWGGTLGVKTGLVSEKWGQSPCCGETLVMNPIGLCLWNAGNLGWRQQMQGIWAPTSAPLLLCDGSIANSPHLSSPCVSCSSEAFPNEWQVPRCYSWSELAGEVLQIVPRVFQNFLLQTVSVHFCDSGLDLGHRSESNFTVLCKFLLISWKALTHSLEYDRRLCKPPESK